MVRGPLRRPPAPVVLRRKADGPREGRRSRVRGSGTGCVVRRPTRPGRGGSGGGCGWLTSCGRAERTAATPTIRRRRSWRCWTPPRGSRSADHHAGRRPDAIVAACRWPNPGTRPTIESWHVGRQRCRLTGTFRLRSGQESSTYVDKYLFEADPGLLARDRRTGDSADPGRHRCACRPGVGWRTCRHGALPGHGAPGGVRPQGGQALRNRAGWRKACRSTAGGPWSSRT